MELFTARSCLIYCTTGIWPFYYIAPFAAYIGLSFPNPVMAASDNAVPSALGGKAERRSPPPPAAQSKRDRKRQALMERLSSMTDKFQREQDMSYRDQLQKVQYEISLVQRFDPYDANALEMAAELQKEHKQTQGPPVHAENARSLMDMAGIKFPNFIDEIEDLVEIRDFQLTQSKVSNDSFSAISSVYK